MKLLILLWILPVILGDSHVTCIYSEDCVLPCSSTTLDIIHWYKDDKPVHSFFHNKDQLVHQSKEYKGRTSLFLESEIKNGNISLILKQISVQDEGRYKCYSANEKTNNEKFVTVSVEAPATSVDITLKGDTVICSTSGVYPEPYVTWSSDPPAVVTLNTTQQTEEKLFNVRSELKVGVLSNTYKYTCSITTKYRTKTATLEMQVSGLGIGGIIGIIAAIIIPIAIAIAIFVCTKRKKGYNKETPIKEEEMKKLNGSSDTEKTTTRNVPSSPESYRNGLTNSHL